MNALVIVMASCNWFRMKAISKTVSSSQSNKYSKICIVGGAAVTSCVQVEGTGNVVQ